MIDILTSLQGQVCFPGGKFDEEDGDTITTALRETDEELGLSTSIPQVSLFSFKKKLARIANSMISSYYL